MRSSTHPATMGARAILLSWACIVAPAAGAAQQPDTASFHAVVVSGHPRGTVVSAVVRIPVGSSQDPEGLEGSAWLLGELLAHRANDVVGPGAAVNAEVGRDETLFTLLSVPESWGVAWRRLEDVLFRERLTDADVEEHRQEVLDALAFDAGSPVRSFEGESAALVAPPSHPWARPIVGTESSVTRLSTSSLSSFKEDRYRQAESTVAVVGPRAAVAGVPHRTPGPTDPSAGAPPAAAPPWQVGDRVELVQDITNTWLAVAWPVGPGAARTSLEFLVHLLQEELDPSPPDPDRFSVDVRIEDTPAGAVVLVEAAVFPEAADRWEGRILQARQRLGGDVMDEDFLGWRRRRFRTARLMAEAAPEAEAARLAWDVAREGAVRDLSLEIWDLTGRALYEAARAMGPPRILRLGPDLGQEGGRQ